MSGVDILAEIRKRQQKEKVSDNRMGSPTTEDWKRFKERMIESVDGEPVKQGTGKTNKEFFKYLKEDFDDDKCPQGDDVQNAKALRKFLKNL